MKSLQSILSPELLNQFTKDLFRAEYDSAVKTISEYGIDLNAAVDDETLLITAVNGFKYCSTPQKREESLRLIEFLLSSGADPAIRDKEGANAFHTALYSSDLELCELFMNSAIEVNGSDEYGSTPLVSFLRFTYSEKAWKGVSLKKRALAVIEELLKRGADPRIEDMHGASARDIRCKERQSVINLLERYEQTVAEKPAPSRAETVLPGGEQ